VQSTAEKAEHAKTMPVVFSKSRKECKAESMTVKSDKSWRSTLDMGHPSRQRSIVEGHPCSAPDSHIPRSRVQDWAETVFPRLRTSLELRAIPSLARWFADQPAQTHLRFGSFTSLIREVNPSISSSDIIRLWYVLEKENSAGEPLVHVDELLRHMLCHAGRNDSLPSKDSIATSDVSRPSVVSARSRPGVDGHPNNLRLDPALVRRY